MKDIALLRRLWPYLRPDAWAFGIALLLTPLAAVLSLIQPYLLKRAIDDHVVPGVLEGLMSIALLYLAAVVAAYFLQGGYVLALAWGAQRSIVRLRSAIYRHLLQLKQSYLDRQPAGRLLTRATSDVDALGEAVSSGLINIVLDLLLIVGTLARHGVARCQTDPGAAPVGAAVAGDPGGHQAPIAGALRRGSRGPRGGECLSGRTGRWRGGGAAVLPRRGVRTPIRSAKRPVPPCHDAIQRLRLIHVCPGGWRGVNLRGGDAVVRIGTCGRFGAEVSEDRSHHGGSPRGVHRVPRSAVPTASGVVGRGSLSCNGARPRWRRSLPCWMWERQFVGVVFGCPASPGITG